jgi:hypothetical protein
MTKDQIIVEQLSNIREELSLLREELEISNSYKKEEKEGDDLLRLSLTEILSTQKEIIGKQSDLLTQELAYVNSQNEIIEKQKILLNAQISTRDNSKD